MIALTLTFMVINRDDMDLGVRDCIVFGSDISAKTQAQ